MSAVDMNSQNTFNIFPITITDNNNVIEFLLKLFFRDEPLNVAMELTKEKDKAENLKNYSLKLLENGELLKYKLNNNFF